MRNVSWLIPGRLAGAAMLGRWQPLAQDLAELRDMGVSLVVTLTGDALDAEAFRSAAIDWLHLPVRDFGVPTTEQLETFIARTDQAIASGGAALVHCFAGRGRTGTFLACYLVAEGTPPAEAIERVRVARPGSIETGEQEDAIGRFGAIVGPSRSRA